MKLWQITVVVAAGVVFGVLQPGKLTYAFGHATLYLFLPVLLFEAAWNLNYRVMKRNWLVIVALVGPGVLLTALLIAGALAIVRVPFVVALLVGAILSATDPIAVVAVFRRLNVPRRLATIVEAESLFNDAVAVVLYRAVLLMVGAVATPLALGRVALGSLLASIGGVVVGIGIALVMAAFLRNRRRVDFQVGATLVCAYGSYFAAELIGASGIFATIACGVALRLYERSWITLDIVDDVARFWDVGALVANVLVFFLVGAALDVREIFRDPAFVIALLLGVAMARIILGGLLLPMGFPRGWLGVVRVAGMRGALSLALAIALPATTPYRETIIGGVFAVTLATLVASALAVPRVVAALARKGTT